LKIQTSTFSPDALHAEQVHQIYNGLDCCLTVEINQELKSIKNSGLPLHYGFHKALQAPILEIMLRGFKVDTAARAEALHGLKSERSFLYTNLQKLALAVQPDNLNPNSTVQLQKLFYGTMGIPEIWSSSKGKRTLSMNRDSLEKLAPYFHARPFVSHILAIRERDKLIQMLETEINEDGRYRTSYNIAGTETGRLSSSSSIDGTGGNAQNLPPNVRKVFCADPGFMLYCIDLEQAESREVGWQCGLLFNDWTYLDACEGGDLHTLAAKLTWPDLEWTGQPKADRAVADQIFYRDFSYRDMAKRGGHGSNYYGAPPSMARFLKVPTSVVALFQERYFGAFPAIPRWHQHVANTIQTTHEIRNAFDVPRLFFGRTNDDTTLRAAIAHGPQSSTAYRTNLALWRIWKHMGSSVQLLGQTHDSVTFQAPIGLNPTDVIKQALELMDVKLYSPNGRVFTVPGEAKIGYNWGVHHPQSNPDGLMKWTAPGAIRPRLPPVSILDRKL